ncbi:complement regulator-acquiring protein (plasmid) [Borrelia miyamotoi]|uniref:Complement regulator-acquiring protein n=1 Tax=Borrelia miyamotoi TaxID=47466 RepID=A0AAP8YSB4_9SPIR|nr:complement regulator-acquiring protein [Borrelia miyamotoi]AHH05431.1 Antigen P35 [Borrelia miyamotoi FR64b]ATQ15228.1 complement regulator-acquiring protein [Borrelia miyamotoi]ATQ16460.1 complement regulator-acquiring protein [Borrelia miyamotoi]ATQ17557.1 complement regulator-acquiring protein [Borrelia miyamotoi]ATQ18801.1 complement regulator-acquiring protein [Borrelia miyamotoi]
MRKNILNNALIIFALTSFTLISCEPYGNIKLKSQKNYQKNENQSDGSTKLEREALNPQLTNEKDEENLTPDLEIKPNEQENPEAILQKESAENKEKTALIAEITKKAQTSVELINEYNKKTEGHEQYGMEWGVFKILKLTKNSKTINSSENKNIRQKLYSSLDWKENTIQKFGQILNAIARNDTNKLAESILEAGVTYTQVNFEETVKTINTKKDNLKKLTLEQLKDIKDNLEKIEELRKKWQDTVNKIIAEHEADTSGIKSNEATLRNYVDSQYNTILKTELPKIKELHQKVTNNLSKI